MDKEGLRVTGESRYWDSVIFPVYWQNTTEIDENESYDSENYQKDKKKDSKIDNELFKLEKRRPNLILEKSFCFKGMGLRHWSALLNY